MNLPVAGALARKLATILGEIGKVAKTGRNDYHKYDYVTENDLVYAVRQKLSDAKIFVFSSVISQKIEVFKDEQTGKGAVLTLVETEHTFVDGETGEQFSVRSQGQGSDTGDKGGYKAITGAMKYFLYKCFMIPTGDDPEGDSKTDQRGAEGVGERRSSSSSTTGHRAPPPRSSPSGKWNEVVVPKFIAKFAGITLGEMADKDPGSLIWWAENYTPKPFNGRVQPADVAFQQALKEGAEQLIEDGYDGPKGGRE